LSPTAASSFKRKITKYFIVKTTAFGGRFL